MALGKVKELVSSNPVVIFSNKLCPHCVSVKQLFVLKLGVQYKAIELDQEMSVYMLQTKLTKHVCGICKKWNQPDSGSWVVEGPCDYVPIPDGAALSAFQYFENVRNFLVAVEELGLPTFEASNLEQGGQSASTRIVNCVLALKSYSVWKQAGGSGSWKFVGNLKPPISGKPFLRKNSEPFMSSFTRTLSWSERSQDSFSSEDPNEASSSHSLHRLVREVLLDKKQEEIPFVKAPSKDSPGPDSDSPSLSEPGSGDIKNEEKAATEIKKDDCCNQTYDHQEGSKEKYSGMKFLQMKYQEDFNSLGMHLHGLAHAASGYQKVLQEHRHNTSVAAGYIRDSAFEPQCWAAPGIHMIPAST